uniref:Reverse transcriptase domain-containing protein n=1 Tax=Tanacetum cinerariifolium TaxID=118510 RepID=A0A6L2JIV0_TANCI|nr:reverse transcriptase domain-containing protein [Tanacetum cinerariifolium]
MQTRSSSRLVSNPSSNATSSTNPNLKGRNRRRSQQMIENFNLDDLSPPIVTMTDQRTMAQLLQAPTEGYEDAIAVPAITVDNFELKHDLFTLVQNKQFFGHDKEDPHAHVRYFNKITSTLKFSNVLNTLIKLMLFLFSLEVKYGIDSNIFFEPVPIMRASLKFVIYVTNPFAKVSTNTSTSDISPDFAELKDMVKALLLDKKSQNQSHAPVKGVEESCVTCGGAHSYRNCPATDGNVYRDNIQEFVSQSSAVNYNQGNTSYRPPMMSNQIRPPSFPSMPNNQNVQRNNQNRFIPNQNWGNNFNQGPVYQPPVFQPPAYQAPAYQAPAPQTQGVLKKDFSAYVKANDGLMRNMQTQGQNMKNQLTNMTDLITKFMNSNSASTSSSGTLPSNIIDNPRSDMKAITTRSGVSYDGPQILLPPSFLPKVEGNEPEVTKDTTNPTNNRNTEDVQPQVVQSESLILTSNPVTSPIDEPTFASVNALKPNPKTSIPYPSRRNDERNPLIGNKEKLSEMAQTLLNEHCSMVLLKKLPKKLGDPGKFLIPCDFPSMAECLALAVLGDNIDLMPFSVWKRLSLPDLTPTCMTLELADHSISHFDAAPRVLLILGRSFLKTGRALIDVFEGDLTFRVGKEAITFNLDQTSRYSANYSDMTAKCIDVIDMAYEYDFLLEEVDAFLAIEDEPTSSEFYQPYLDPKGDILILEAFLIDDPSLPTPNQRNYMPEIRKELKICEAKSDKSSVDEPPVVIKLLEAELIYPISDSPWVSPVHCVPKKGGFSVIENKDNELILTRLVTGWRVCIDYHKLNKANRKDHFPLPFMDQILKRLAGNQYYCFLNGCSGYFQIPIDPKDQKKTTSPDHTEHLLIAAYLLGYAMHQARFRQRMLKRCEDINLCLNWEKSHFMVKEGENRASWSDKLDDALWAFRTTYKTLIGCTPYKLVYRKACHLSVELKQKAYWALKHANFDLKTAGDHRKVQINDLNKFHDQAYENSLIYKEKTKRLHDSKIKNRVFNIGDRVLLFKSRLKIFSSKLKSRWPRPFINSQVYPYGTVELSQPDAPNFKVNGHRVKHYFGKDVPKLVVPDLQTFPKNH